MATDAGVAAVEVEVVLRPQRQVFIEDWPRHAESPKNRAPVPLFAVAESGSRQPWRYDSGAFPPITEALGFQYENLSGY